jgi:4-amino-4-deoxy-L-arabinose transferase-like glycosyltransferase
MSPNLRLRVGFWVAVACALAWKCGELWLPPHGEHAWRDADGLGVAWGFLHDGATLWLPKVVERGAQPGVVGMEWPLVNGLSAAFQAVLGESWWAARLPVWLSAALLGLGQVRLGRAVLGSELGARLAGVCLVWQPLVLVFSRKLMPDVPMLAALVWGLAWSLEGLQSRAWRPTVLGGLALAVAAVLKPTSATGGVLLVAWAVQHRSERPWARLALIAAVPAAAAGAWYAHARALDVAYGLPLFRLHHDWLEWLPLLASWSFLSVAFGRVLHLYLLWPTVIAMALRAREALGVLRLRPPLAAWLVASLLGVTAMGSHLFQHSYYALPCLPPLCLWVGGFLEDVSRTWKRRELALAAFLAVFALFGAVRTLPRFPAMDSDQPALEEAMARVPAGGLVVATDAHTPVVSLVRLHRVGWGLPASELTPSKLAQLQDEGATHVVESEQGGWLGDDARAWLGAPIQASAQVRAYALPARRR